MVPHKSHDTYSLKIEGPQSKDKLSTRQKRKYPIERLTSKLMKGKTIENPNGIDFANAEVPAISFRFHVECNRDHS